MSMIYECPNCHMPQAAGLIVCRHCGAEFDSPVPDDAFLPEGTAPEPPPEPGLSPAGEPEPVNGGELRSEETDSVATEVEPEAEATTPTLPAAEPNMPPSAPIPTPSIEENLTPPTLAESLAPQSTPYAPPADQTAPAYSRPTESAEQTPAAPRPSAGKTLTRALLIALPLVLLVVLGSVYFAHSLDAGQDTSPVPPASLTATVPASIPAAAPPPADPPYVINGTVAEPDARGDAKSKRLVGRWEAATSDFYVFKHDGTGSRGNLMGKRQPETFLWVLVQNQIILYAEKQEKLAVSPGPDENTIFLRGESGKYVQYSRVKTQTDPQ